MQIVTGRRGEPHVTSRQMQAVYRSFLGDFALLDIGEKLRAEAYSNDIVRVYDGVVSVQGIYAVIAYNQYDEVYIEPVSVGKKRIDTIVLHYTKNNTLDVEDMQLDVVQGEEYTDNPVPPTISEGGDAWEGTTDIQVAIYDVEVTNFGLTVTPYARMLNLIPTLESIAERIPDTVVTGVKGDSEVLYRDGDVNITKANIGLGNVDNTADTDKPISTATQTALNLKADLTYVDAKISAAYHAGGSKTVAELTSALLIAENMGKVFNMSDSGVTTSDFVEGAGEPINEGDNVGICNVGTEESPVYKFDLLSGFVDLSAYATTSAVNTALAGKVDKVAGKGLSTEDYTTTEKTKLAGIEAEANKTVVDSSMSDSSTNPLQNKVITKELEGAKTATGNPITIEDAAPVNAVNLNMDLEPIQDLHGYDNPWVGGAGKNKLPMTVEGIKAANTSGTWNGNVYSINNGTIEILVDSDNNVIGLNANGTFNELYFDIGEPIITGNSRLTGCPSGGDFNTLYALYLLRPGEGAIANDSGNGNDITLQTNDSIWIVIRNGTTVSNVIFKPMVGTDMTATYNDFAPYTNICPISGRSEVAIQRVGKNLCEPANYTKNESDGVTYIDPSTDVAITEPITLPAGTYTISLKLISKPSIIKTLAFATSRYSGILAIFNNINNLTVGTIYTRDITLQKETTFTGWLYGNTGGGEFKMQIQIELGSTATTYEPYAGKTYTIQIGQTVYGGQLDVTRGKMVVDRGIVAINDLSLYRSVSRVGYRIASATLSQVIKPISSSEEVANISCEIYEKASVADIYNGVIGIGVNTEQEIWMTCPDAITTTADFKTAYGSYKICYELATPFTIDLTPTQIKMLENTNTISTNYEGDTITIEYQLNNAIGEAVRVVEESYDPEFAVRPVLKKKAFSGTTDSDGAVTLINASDIPSNHRIIPLQITDMTIGGSAGTYFVEYKPYNSGDSVKGYCYSYYNGSQITPVGSAVTGNFYYYELEV